MQALVAIIQQVCLDSGNYSCGATDDGSHLLVGACSAHGGMICRLRHSVVYQCVQSVQHNIASQCCMGISKQATAQDCSLYA